MGARDRLHPERETVASNRGYARQKISDIHGLSGCRALELNRCHEHCPIYASGVIPEHWLMRASLPWLSPQHRAARAGEEAGLHEQRHDQRLRHGLAVEALDRETLRTATLDEPDERLERRTQPLLIRLP